MHSLACMDMWLWRRKYIECANQCFTLWRACAYWASLYHLHLRLNSKPLTENSAERLAARILLQNRLSSDTRHLVSESLSEAPTTNRCMQWEFLVASCDNNEERNMSDGYHGNGYQTMFHLFPHWRPSLPCHHLSIQVNFEPNLPCCFGRSVGRALALKAEGHGFS